MTTFSITDQPSQVYLGDQPLVTVYNDGPSTVWLSDTPAVDVYNGFELPPTGQMTWKNDRELWAVGRKLGSTVFGSQLKTSIAGDLAITTRARFLTPLKQTDNTFHSTVQGAKVTSVECGHASTLRIYRRYVRSGAFVAGQFENVQFSWLADDGQIILTESLTVNLSQLDLMNATTDYYVINIPVKGRYVSFSVNSTTVMANADVRIYGTDADEPFWCNSGKTGPTGFTSSWGNENTLIWSGWNLTDIYFPSMGNEINIEFTSSAVTTGTLLVTDVESLQQVAALTVPTGGPVWINKEILVPPRRALKINQFGIGGAGPHIIAITQNYR